MCEYCGCQALDSIKQLTDEHDLVVDLVGELRRAIARDDLDGIDAGCRRVLEVLAPHTRVEEEALFPVMARDFPIQIAELEAEHRSIEAILGLGADAPPGALAAALTQLREHILKEQDGVFPAALQTLTAAQWDAVDSARVRA